MESGGIRIDQMELTPCLAVEEFSSCEKEWKL